MKIKATSTTVDDEAKPRYWLESIEGQTNVEGFDSMVEAFQCYGPQGVAGCGFESRLESMFWTDPNDPAPSSAMCWNAGVKCDGEGPNYTACRAENFDAEGNPGATDEAAVLQPISKYVKFLQTIEDSKQAIDPTQEVLVSMIAGGPDGYENGTAPLVYEDSADAKFQADFGIVADHQLLLPAVGYRQWVLSFSGPLAVRLGYDQALLATVAESLARAAMQNMRWAVKERHGLTSVEPLHAGVFTVVQRFRSDLGLYVHLHCLVTDGAFDEQGAEVRFLPAPTPDPLAPLAGHFVMPALPLAPRTVPKSPDRGLRRSSPGLLLADVRVVREDVVASSSIACSPADRLTALCRVGPVVPAQGDPSNASITSGNRRPQAHSSCSPSGSSTHESSCP